jgi:hypothetical protein
MLFSFIRTSLELSGRFARQQHLTGRPPEAQISKKEMHEMKPANTLATLFRHNLWANLRLLERCSELTGEQLDATIVGGFGSIQDTLEHIVRAEQVAGASGPPGHVFEVQTWPERGRRAGSGIKMLHEMQAAKDAAWRDGPYGRLDAGAAALLDR